MHRTGVETLPAHGVSIPSCDGTSLFFLLPSELLSHLAEGQRAVLELLRPVRQALQLLPAQHGKIMSLAHRRVRLAYAAPRATRTRNASRGGTGVVGPPISEQGPPLPLLRVKKLLSSAKPAAPLPWRLPRFELPGPLRTPAGRRIRAESRRRGWLDSEDIC